MVFFFSARSVSASSSGLSSTKSMILLSMIPLPPPCSGGLQVKPAPGRARDRKPVPLQREVERRAFFDRSFRPNLSAMSVDDSLHRGEAHAGAWKLRRGVQALEGSEKTVCIAGIKSGAVVPHEKWVLTVLLALAEFDPGTGVGGGVLPGIAKQVFHRRSQQLRISHGHQITFDHELYSPARLRFLKVRGDRFRHGTQIELFAAHHASGDAGEIQHIVNQYGHALCR